MLAGCQRNKNNMTAETLNECYKRVVLYGTHY